MILKVKPDGRKLLNYLNNIMKRTIIPLCFKPGENLKIFCRKDGQTVHDYIIIHEKLRS